MLIHTELFSDVSCLGLEKNFGPRPRPRPHCFWPWPHAQLASLTSLERTLANSPLHRHVLMAMVCRDAEKAHDAFSQGLQSFDVADAAARSAAAAAASSPASLDDVVLATQDAAVARAPSRLLAAPVGRRGRRDARRGRTTPVAAVPRPAAAPSRLLAAPVGRCGRRDARRDRTSPVVAVPRPAAPGAPSRLLAAPVGRRGRRDARRGRAAPVAVPRPAAAAAPATAAAAARAAQGRSPHRPAGARLPRSGRARRQAHRPALPAGTAAGQRQLHQHPWPISHSGNVITHLSVITPHLLLLVIPC